MFVILGYHEVYSDGTDDMVGIITSPDDESSSLLSIHCTALLCTALHFYAHCVDDLSHPTMNPLSRLDPNTS